MSTERSQAISVSPRLAAALVLARHLAGKLGGDVRDHLAIYLGCTGGDHILRDKAQRIWSVDFVTGHCILCVGLAPSKWKHPPQVAA